MKEQVGNTHNNCTISIRWKLYKGHNLPTPALFCKCHNKFLDWINPNIAYDLIDNHHIEVEPWEKKLSGSPKPKVKKTTEKKSLRKKRIKKQQIKKVNAEYKKRFGVAV
jgi:hypothetical protein